MLKTKMGQEVVLDDGMYRVVLDPGQQPDMADGFLERRCFTGSQTPSGLSCVGSFGQDADGTWSAKIAAVYDAGACTDCVVVARSVERFDAIVALWHARQDAYLGYAGL